MRIISKNMDLWSFEDYMDFLENAIFSPKLWIFKNQNRSPDI